MHEQVGIQDSLQIRPTQDPIYRFILHWDYSRATELPERERNAPRTSWGVEYPDGFVHIRLPDYTFDTMLQLERFFELRGNVRIEWIDVPPIEEQ